MMALIFQFEFSIDRLLLTFDHHTSHKAPQASYTLGFLKEKDTEDTKDTH